MKLNEDYKLNKEQFDDLKYMKTILYDLKYRLSNVKDEYSMTFIDEVDDMIYDLDGILMELCNDIRVVDNIFESIEHDKIVDDIIELNNATKKSSVLF